jgi:DHA1 family tetracycline resistance protein-like MFS transporter
MCLATTVWGYFVLPESLPKDRRARFTWARANPVGALAMLVSVKGLIGLAGVALLYQLAQNVFPSTFALYAAFRYEWTSDAIGLCLGLVGVSGIIVSLLAVQPFVRAFGERIAVAFGLACMATALIIYGAAPFAAAFLIGVPFGALSGLYGPAAQSLMTQRIDPTRQGQLQGALASIMGLTGMIGPTLYTGALAWGIAPGGPGLPGAAFFIAAVFAGSACLLAWFATANLSKRPGAAPT